MTINFFDSASGAHHFQQFEELLDLLKYVEIRESKIFSKLHGFLTEYSIIVKRVRRNERNKDFDIMYNVDILYCVACEA